MNGTNQTQAQIFATEYAKNTANGMLDAVRKIGRRAGTITKIALGVSMPHQIGYILALAWPHMTWTTVTGWLESITMILLAVAVPIATDLLILNCVETIGAAAAARGSKIRAFCIILIPVAASGTVNFLAPAPLLIKVLAAFIVTMIPMGESLKFIRPDFAKIERMEFEVAAQVAPTVTVDEALRAKRSEAAKRGAATKAAKAKAATVRKPRAPKAATVEQLEEAYSLPSAPVSGA